MTTRRDDQRGRRGRPVTAGDRWQARYAMLVDTLTRAGVDLSFDDHTAVEHIARWEPATVRAIASWVIRAAAAQRPSLSDLTARDDAARETWPRGTWR